MAVMVFDWYYEVHNNEEQGKGRYDIYLKSKKGKQDILMELKYTKDEPMNLKTLADKGLQQIKDGQYVVSDHTQMAGLAFRGNHVEISYETFVIPQE